jgi:hypothetical protein
MSNKRQKVSDTECSALVKEALKQYLIDDLVSMVVDDYVPTVHFIQCKYMTEKETWQMLNFPCAPDCGTYAFPWVEHKLRGADIKGPFRLRNLTRSSEFLDDNGLLVTTKIVFQHGNSVIECRRDVDSSIMLGEVQEVLRGKGVNDFVDMAVHVATDFLARYKCTQ